MGAGGAFYGIIVKMRVVFPKVARPRFSLSPKTLTKRGRDL
jgi:hypothetical protein